jgi:integrase
MRLTAATAKSITIAPGKTDQVFFDDDIPGFGLRVRASGVKTWIYQYAVAGRTRRITLGNPTVVDPGRARDAAKDLAAQVRLGRDPSKEKVENRAKAKDTFQGFIPRYLDRLRQRAKPGSYKNIERHLTKYTQPLHPLPIASINRRIVGDFLEDITKARGSNPANGVRKTLSAYFNWLIRIGAIEANPASFLEPAVECPPRTRVLDDAELRAIWITLDGGDYFSDYIPIVKLLILTGARLTEIGSLSWQEVDWTNALIILPPERCKNRREHVIPLSPLALSILEAQHREAGNVDRGFVFGSSKIGFRGWGGAKDILNYRLDAAGLGITNWRHHDFRRSLSTALHERFNIQPHIVEIILGHVGHQRGIGGVYNRAMYLVERRRALERWADHITSLVSNEPASAQVIRLR